MCAFKKSGLQIKGITWKQLSESSSMGGKMVYNCFDLETNQPTSQGEK